MLWPPVREPCSSCPTYNNLLLEHRAAGPLHTPGRAGAEGVRKQPADHACEIMAPKRGFLKRGAGLAACKLHTLKLLTAHAKPPGACAVNMAIMAAWQQPVVFVYSPWLASHIGRRKSPCRDLSHRNDAEGFASGRFSDPSVRRLMGSSSRRKG